MIYYLHPFATSSFILWSFSHRIKLSDLKSDQPISFCNSQACALISSPCKMFTWYSSTVMGSVILNSFINILTNFTLFFQSQVNLDGLVSENCRKWVEASNGVRCSIQKACSVLTTSTNTNTLIYNTNVSMWGSFVQCNRKDTSRELWITLFVLELKYM